MSAKNQSKVIIIDATAFYAGVPYNSLDTYYTTEPVVEEIAHIKTKSGSLENLIEIGRVRVYRPSEQYLEKVRSEAVSSGDSTHLSTADISIIALGLELKSDGFDVTLVSDDFSVGNLSYLLGLKVSTVMTLGIKKVVQWVVYCYGCGKTFKDSKLKVCDVCGSPLKRKFKKTSNLNRT